MNKLDAVRKWVDGMDAIPLSLITKAYANDIDSWQELTTPTVGSRIWVNELQATHEVVEVYDDAFGIIHEGEEVKISKAGIYPEFGDVYPMWGWLWVLESIDQEWIEKNVDLVSACGFRVFDTEETGILIGIDGAGYDFYENHWIPLYNARELQWHNQE